MFGNFYFESSQFQGCCWCPSLHVHTTPNCTSVLSPGVPCHEVQKATRLIVAKACFGLVVAVVSLCNSGTLDQPCSSSKLHRLRASAYRPADCLEEHPQSCWHAHGTDLRPPGRCGHQSSISSRCSRLAWAEAAALEDHLEAWD